MPHTGSLTHGTGEGIPQLFPSPFLGETQTHIKSRAAHLGWEHTRGVYKPSQCWRHSSIAEVLETTTFGNKPLHRLLPPFPAHAGDVHTGTSPTSPHWAQGFHLSARALPRLAEQSPAPRCLPGSSSDHSHAQLRRHSCLTSFVAPNYTPG